MDNQTCYLCKLTCRPGKGVTDADGRRRHVQCPGAEQTARKREAISRVHEAQSLRRRTQGTGIVATPEQAGLLVPGVLKTPDVG